jgi:hypothetical protein
MVSMFVGVLDFAKAWILFFFYLYINFITWPLKIWLRLVFWSLSQSEKLPVVGTKVKRAKGWVTSLRVISWALKQKTD